MEETSNKNVQKHDLFISYSSKNKNLADAVVSRFENNGIKCWYAPRDIMPGQEWVSAIREGLNSARIFVLIYTEDSNLSRQVMNEVALAFNAGKTLVPFRLTEEMMNDELEYYLTRVHWLDAVSKPLEASIDSLYDYISVILQHLKNGGTLTQNQIHPDRNVNTQVLNREETGNGIKRSDDGNSEPKSLGKEKKMKIILWGVGALAVVLIIIGICVFVKLSKPSKNDINEQDTNNLEINNSDTNNAENTLPNSKKEDSGSKTNDLDLKDGESEKTPLTDPESTAEELMEEGYRILCYEEDDGANDRARDYFTKAAEKGSADAHYYLGRTFENDYDFKAAKQEYEKGINAGSDLARLGLGTILEKGLCGESDMNKAWDLYNEALNNGCVEADYYRASMILYGFAGQKADAVLSVSLLKNVINSSKLPNFVTLAYFGLGKIYRRGVLGVEKDYDAAIEAYNKGYDSLPSAECKRLREVYLGFLYEEMGESVKADDHFRVYLDAFKDIADSSCSVTNLYYCGSCYYYGYGTEIDYKEALRWFEASDKKAKEKNINSCCPEALFYIGSTYENGLDCDKDYEKAYKYYKEAADFGYGDAAESIGDLYANGLRGKDEEGNNDYDMARQWYEKALEHGCVNAYGDLGQLYSDGLGVDKDENMANEYLLKGAEHGSPNCILQLALNCSHANKYDEAFQWVQILASFDNYYAYNLLGTMYLNGFGTEKNEEKALEMLKVAANKKNRAALATLARYYYYGVFSTGVDYSEAFKYAQKGAVLDEEYCMYILGIMYLEGQGTEVNFEKAEKWLLSASEAGEETAMLNYGTLKLYGYESIEKNESEGIAWLKKAGENGNVNGYTSLANHYYAYEEWDEFVNCLDKAYVMYGSELPDVYVYNLMFCYYEGKGTEENFEKAFELANVLSKERNYTYGMVFLGDLYNYGIGTEPDYKEALKWYGAALSSGEMDYNDVEIIKSEINEMVDAGLISREEADNCLNVEQEVLR